MKHTLLTRRGASVFAGAGLLPVAMLASVLFAGCASQEQVDPDVMQVATTPLTCTDKAQCDMWWQRARTWVTDHSKYPVETANDSLIQTSGPDGGKRALAYQITRTPNSDGTATIGFAAHCDGSLGCKPNPWEAGASFKEFVRGTDAGNGPRGSMSGKPGAATSVAPQSAASEPASTDQVKRSASEPPVSD